VKIIIYSELWFADARRRLINTTYIVNVGKFE